MGRGPRGIGARICGGSSQKLGGQHGGPMGLPGKSRGCQQPPPPTLANLILSLPPTFLYTHPLKLPLANSSWSL